MTNCGDKFLYSALVVALTAAACSTSTPERGENSAEESASTTSEPTLPTELGDPSSWGAMLVYTADSDREWFLLAEGNEPTLENRLDVVGLEFTPLFSNGQTDGFTPDGRYLVGTMKSTDRGDTLYVIDTATSEVFDLRSSTTITGSIGDGLAVGRDLADECFVVDLPDTMTTIGTFDICALSANGSNILAYNGDRLTVFDASSRDVVYETAVADLSPFSANAFFIEGGSAVAYLTPDTVPVIVDLATGSELARGVPAGNITPTIEVEGLHVFSALFDGTDTLQSLASDGWSVLLPGASGIGHRSDANGFLYSEGDGLFFVSQAGGSVALGELTGSIKASAEPSRAFRSASERFLLQAGQVLRVDALGETHNLLADEMPAPIDPDESAGMIDGDEFLLVLSTGTETRVALGAGYETTSSYDLEDSGSSVVLDPLVGMGQRLVILAGVETFVVDGTEIVALGLDGPKVRVFSGGATQQVYLASKLSTVRLDLSGEPTFGDFLPGYSVAALRPAE